MLSRDMKKAVIEAYTEATPDILERIKASCGTVEQIEYDKTIVNFNSKRKPLDWKIASTWVASLVLVSTLSFAIGTHVINSNNVETPAPEMSAEPEVEQIHEITFQIEPGINMTIDDSGNVIRIEAEDVETQSRIDELSLSEKPAMDAINEVKSLVRQIEEEHEQEQQIIEEAPVPEASELTPEASAPSIPAHVTSVPQQEIQHEEAVAEENPAEYVPSPDNCDRPGYGYGRERNRGHCGFGMDYYSDAANEGIDIFEDAAHRGLDITNHVLEAGERITEDACDTVGGFWDWMW